MNLAPKKQCIIFVLFNTVFFVAILQARHFKMAPQADPLNLYTGIFENIHVPQESIVNVAIKGEYRRSLRGSDITDCLFGDALVTYPSHPTQCCSANNGKKLLIQGSRVINRNGHALLADYFGLPTDFSSEVTFFPRIDQGIIDLSIWYTHNHCCTGMWLFLRTQVVSQKTRLNAAERILASGTNNFAPVATNAGYFSPATITRSDLLNSFGEFTSGNAPSLGIGTIFEPLRYGKFSTSIVVPDGSMDGDCCFDNGSNCIEETRVGDVHIGVGWDLCQAPDHRYHAGIGALLVIPTGTRINSGYLLTPQIGNNHHFELGGIWTSHYLLWKNGDGQKYWNLHMEAQVSHLFRSCELHTFGLCNPNANCNISDMSQYMLAMQFGVNPPAALTQGSPYSPTVVPWFAPNVPPAVASNANGVFNGHYSPVANLTTKSVEVSVRAHGYVLAALNYHSHSFDGEVGYQFYGRSHDEYDCSANRGYFSNAIPGAWALKGDSYVYGFSVTDAGGGPFGTGPAVALSATQSKACITGGLNFKGINLQNVAQFNNARLNRNVDNANFAYVLVGTNQYIVISQPGGFGSNPPNPGEESQQVRTSIQPIYLNDSNIDVAREQSKEQTHTLFASINHHWDFGGDYEPCLGAGGRIDFSSRKNPDSPYRCSATTCGKALSGLTQWGFWIKASVSFI